MGYKHKHRWLAAPQQSEWFSDAGYRSALVLIVMPNPPALALTTVVSVILLLIGYATFKRSEPLFVDLT